MRRLLNEAAGDAADRPSPDVHAEPGDLTPSPALIAALARLVRSLAQMDDADRARRPATARRSQRKAVRP
jgi:hypothetical protein